MRLQVEDQEFEAQELFSDDGWTIIRWGKEAGQDFIGALHSDTGHYFELEDSETGSPLQEFDQADEYREDRSWEDFIASGEIRARGAIHGAPGASPLGALLI